MLKSVSRMIIGHWSKRAIGLVAMLGIAGAAQSPAFAESPDITPPRIFLTSQTGVSLQDGRYTYSNIDLTIGPFSLQRSYQGGLTVKSAPFGYGWTHNYEMYLIANCPFPNPCTHVVIGRTSYKFIPNGTGGYTGVSDITLGSIDPGVSLVPNASGLLFTDRKGVTYQFQSNPPSGTLTHVTQVIYPNGHRLDFTYDGSNNLRSVTSNMGYMLGFDYNSNNQIVRACGFDLALTYTPTPPSCATAAMRTIYQYNASDSSLLTGFTDLAGNLSTVSYSGNQVACVTLPASTTCPVSNTYYNDNDGGRYFQVKQQTTADGKIWSFTYSGTYDCAMCEEGQPGDLNSTHMTDPTGAVTILNLDAKVPTSFVDANGRGTTILTPEWAATEGEHSEGTAPEGNLFLYARNARGVIGGYQWGPRSGSTDAPIATSSQFPTCTSTNYRICNLPQWTRDELGNETDFTYDQNNGGVLSEMKPAPSPGKARPLKLTTWVSKNAYVKNSVGTLVAVSTSLAVINTETLCQTLAGSNSPTCDPSAPQRVTTYTYGANGTADNVRVKGVVVTGAGKTLRTCYGYDAAGNRISTTTPNANLASCP